MTSREQNQSLFWCTDLKFVDAGIYPYMKPPLITDADLVEKKTNGSLSCI